MSETVWMAESGMVHIAPDGRMCPVVAMVFAPEKSADATVGVIVLSDGRLEHVSEGRIAYPGSRSHEYQYACATNGMEMPRQKRRGKPQVTFQNNPPIVDQKYEAGKVPLFEQERDRVSGKYRVLPPTQERPHAELKAEPPLFEAPTYEQLQAEARERGGGEMTQPQESVPPREPVPKQDNVEPGKWYPSVAHRGWGFRDGQWERDPDDPHTYI
jgi:hypothetical protein